MNDAEFLRVYIDQSDEDLPLRDKRIKAAYRLLADSAVVYVEGEYWVRAFIDESLELDRARMYIARLQGEKEELEGQIDDMEVEIMEMDEYE